MPLTTVLWDMDGTLLDSEPAHEHAFYAAVQELGLVLPTDAHDAFLGCSGIDVHAGLCRLTGVCLPLQDWLALKWKHYQRFAHEIVPLLGIESLLLNLQQHGTKMALVSNSTRDEVDLNLQACALAAYFPVQISRDDVGQGKPDPEAYLLAAKRLGATPEQCVVIEDSPTGAKAGVAAGMLTLFKPQAEVLMSQCPAGAQVVAPEADLAVVLSQWLN